MKNSLYFKAINKIYSSEFTTNLLLLKESWYALKPQTKKREYIKKQNYWITIPKFYFYILKFM